MKYILMCAAALSACLVCGWIPAKLIGKHKKLSRKAVISLTIIFSLLFVCAVTFGYLSVFYHADKTAVVHSPAVQMEKTDGGFFFDGPGEDTALVFYPGAKVEAIAYAPLMNALAERGIDCFLADMPFRMAIFGSGLAGKFIGTRSYEHWIAAGHSMGGLVISGYAADHPGLFDNLILLAAYPGSRMPDSLALCSVYGTQDGCLNHGAYENAKEYWPVRSAEYVLTGGNHAGFAAYGPQSGDGEAGITREEQLEQTVEIILREVKDNDVQ